MISLSFILESERNTAMLKEERLSRIIQIVNERGTVKTTDISEALDASLATVRRDLNELASMNKIVKVFGGASSIDNAQYVMTEDDMAHKSQLNIQEKKLIGKYAAGLINQHDFVYLDAGTTVEAMIPYITAHNATYVTNSLSIAKQLAHANQQVIVLPGEYKIGTGAVVGPMTCDFLNQFNFKVGFFGTNGIHKDIGFTTPDVNEAQVKSKAIQQCRRAYILADSSKFGKVSQVTFANDPQLEIISDSKDKDYTDIVIRKLGEKS